MKGGRRDWLVRKTPGVCGEPVRVFAGSEVRLVGKAAGKRGNWDAGRMDVGPGNWWETAVCAEGLEKGLYGKRPERRFGCGPEMCRKTCKKTGSGREYAGKPLELSRKEKRPGTGKRQEAVEGLAGLNWPPVGEGVAEGWGRMQGEWGLSRGVTGNRQGFGKPEAWLVATAWPGMAKACKKTSLGGHRWQAAGSRLVRKAAGSGTRWPGIALDAGCMSGWLPRGYSLARRPPQRSKQRKKRKTGKNGRRKKKAEKRAKSSKAKLGPGKAWQLCRKRKLEIKKNEKKDKREDGKKGEKMWETATAKVGVGMYALPGERAEGKSKWSIKTWQHGASPVELHSQKKGKRIGKNAKNNEKQKIKK